MKSKALSDVKPYIQQRWGGKKAEQIFQLASSRLDVLCRENSQAPKAVKKHTETNIFPCISLYEALQQSGISQDEALSFLDESWSRKAKAGAESTKKVLAFAGLYRLYPAMFKIVAKQQFGAAAGFESKFYITGKGRCKFDMTKCLFYDTCTRCGCPELTKCFCHVDDINNENLHPRLCWNRTKFMGGGADLCDFDIFVLPKK